MAQVVMVVHEENGAYGASFPDFPGCTTVARDLDALFAKAREVLPWHVQGLVEDGEPVPGVRSLAELRLDSAFQEDTADAALVGFVSVDLPGKSVRVNITVDELVLDMIDQAAKAAGESRSGFLVTSALQRIKAARQPAPEPVRSSLVEMSGDVEVAITDLVTRLHNLGFGAGRRAKIPRDALTGQFGGDPLDRIVQVSGSEPHASASKGLPAHGGPKRKLHFRGKSTG